MPVNELTVLNIVCDNPACPGNTLDPKDRNGWTFVSAEVYSEGPMTNHVYCSAECLSVDSGSLTARFEVTEPMPIEEAPAT